MLDCKWIEKIELFTVHRRVIYPSLYGPLKGFLVSERRPGFRLENTRNIALDNVKRLGFRIISIARTCPPLSRPLILGRFL